MRSVAKLDHIRRNQETEGMGAIGWSTDSSQQLETLIYYHTTKLVRTIGYLKIFRNNAQTGVSAHYIVRQHCKRRLGSLVILMMCVF